MILVFFCTLICCLFLWFQSCWTVVKMIIKDEYCFFVGSKENRRRSLICLGLAADCAWIKFFNHSDWKGPWEKSLVQLPAEGRVSAEFRAGLRASARSRKPLGRAVVPLLWAACSSASLQTLFALRAVRNSSVTIYRPFFVLLPLLKCSLYCKKGRSSVGTKRELRMFYFLKICYC